MQSKKYLPTIIAIITVLGITLIGFLLTSNNQKMESSTGLAEVFQATDFTSDRSRFFDTLRDTDWNIIIKSNSTLTLEILEKLNSIEFQNDTELQSVLTAYRGLDGAYAELYSVIISKLYLDDELNTALLLSQLSDDNIQEALKYIKYGCSYENTDKAFEDSYKLLKSNEISDKERAIINKIVN